MTPNRPLYHATQDLPNRESLSIYIKAQTFHETQFMTAKQHIGAALLSPSCWQICYSILIVLSYQLAKGYCQRSNYSGLDRDLRYLDVMFKHPQQRHEYYLQ